MSQLRRKDREITDPVIIEQVLSSGRFVTIALCDGSDPYVVTLSYGYDAAGRRLCFHSARTGRKTDIIAANPRACATVVVDRGYAEGECAHPYRSVVMTGHMRVIDDIPEAREAMRVLTLHLEGPDAMQEVWNRNGLADDAAFGRVAMLEFRIESLCAKQGQ